MRITAVAHAPSTVLSVKGTIEAMDDETARFYHEAIGYDYIAAEYQGQFPALVLKVNKVYGHTPTSLWLALAGGLAALGACIWFLIRALSGSYQKALLQFCADTGDKDMALERVEAFYHDTQPVNGLRMGEAFTMFHTRCENAAAAHVGRGVGVSNNHTAPCEFYPHRQILWYAPLGFGRPKLGTAHEKPGCRAGYAAYDISEVPACADGLFRPAGGAG